MKDSTIEAIGWLSAAGIATAAAFVPAAPGAAAVSEAILPAVVAIVMLCGWTVRDTRWLTPVLLQVPLIFAIAVSVPHESMKMLGSGLSLAFAVAGALWSRHSESRLDQPTGLVLLLSVLSLMRLAEVPADKLLVSLVIVAGSGVLLAVLAHRRALTPVHWIIAFACGVGVPLAPSRLAVVPLLFAALVWVVRSVRIGAPLAGLVLTAFLAGRWAWPLALAGAAIHLVARRSGHAELATLAPGVWGASLQMVLRPVPFVLAGLGAVRSAPLVAAGAVVVMAGGGLLRPAIAILYGLAASVILAARDESSSTRFAGPASVIAFLMLAMFFWSGALIGAFPLPVPALSLGVIVAGAAVTMMSSRGRLMTVLSAGLLVIAVVLSTGEAGPWSRMDSVLRPGESVNLTPPSAGNSAALVLSGGNLLGISNGQAIADVDVISVRGRTYRRSLSVGDVSDWAALQQKHWFVSEHGAPALPVGPLSGYGASSFLIGAGSIEVVIPEAIALVRVTMREDLHDDAMLHVDALRLGRR